jgi:FADH2 O2-dependent halogenase
MAFARRGRRVALIERGRHPRFVIGESTTPLTNLLLEELADRWDLPRIRPFSKWGTWQRSRPDVACGLKRGFSFFFHREAEPFAEDDGHDGQLLVAASPHDEVADTHWYRPDFDLAFVHEAQAAGVVYLDATRLDAVREDSGGMTLEGERAGGAVRITAGFVIDASGVRGFLAGVFGLDAPLRWLPPTAGLYTHFEQVGLWDDLSPPDGTPPYPRDAAALHHVFPGGWIWVLRFNNGLTSAGAALTMPLAARVLASEGAAGWHRLLERYPSIAAQFRTARPTRPFVFAPRLAFRCRRVVGDRWALLPSAAGLIDPLLSTGFPLTLLGMGRLLDLLESTAPGPERSRALADYEAATQQELDATEQLVAALYQSMDDPELFRRLSLLYFAAASYSEAARRLGSPDLAPGFLLQDHPRFGPEVGACAALAAARPEGAARQALVERIDRVIEPFDIAGLRADRRHWFPALADDLIGNAWKLGASREEVAALLDRCGFDAAPAAALPSAGGARAQGRRPATAVACRPDHPPWLPQNRTTARGWESKAAEDQIASAAEGVPDRQSSTQRPVR